jgi:hypothetical protein
LVDALARVLRRHDRWTRRRTDARAPSPLLAASLARAVRGR